MIVHSSVFHCHLKTSQVIKFYGSHFTPQLNKPLQIFSNYDMACSLSYRSTQTKLYFFIMAVPVFCNQLRAYAIVVYFSEINLLHYMALKLFNYWSVIKLC
jgi:hypothetical protein